MRNKLSIILLFIFINIVGCSVYEIPNDNFIIKTQVTEPNNIRFIGKGAGAGVMLMSVMGPMGVAIGVAIDEGIANEIDTTAKTADVNIEAITLQKLSSAIITRAEMELNHASSKDEITVDILRYGFMVSPSDGNLVIPQLHLNISLNEKLWLKLRYPEQLTELQKNEAKTASLTDIRSKGEVIESLLVNALSKVQYLIMTSH